MSDLSSGLFGLDHGIGLEGSEMGDSILLRVEGMT